MVYCEAEFSKSGHQQSSALHLLQPHCHQFLDFKHDMIPVGEILGIVLRYLVHIALDSTGPTGRSCAYER